MAALLCALPCRREGQRTRGEGDSPSPRLGHKFGTALAAAVAAATLLALLYLTVRRLDVRIAYFPRILRIDVPLLYVCIPAVVAYLFFSPRRAFASDALFSPRLLLASIAWKRAALTGLCLALVAVMRRAVWSGEVMQWGNTRSFIMYTLLSALTEPLIFLLSHVVYFGPVILLLLIYWRPFRERLREFGLGLRALVILNLLLSSNPRSRYQINVVTIFIVLLVKLLDRSVLRAQSLALWVLLSLLYSKVWYTMNTAPQVDDGKMDVLLNFPLQHIFMNVGPWMSRGMFFVQGGVVALTSVFVYLLLRRGRERELADGLSAGARLTQAGGA